MLEPPTVSYGANRVSHYQGQLSTLSKHFRIAKAADQQTFSRPLPRRRAAAT